MLQINNNTSVKRSAYDQVLQYLTPGKVVVVYGPRRVGKTTLLNQITADLAASERILSVTGEDRNTHEPLSSQRTATLESFLGDTTLLIIDEAQIIPNIGRNLKLLVDTQPNLKIIASGSATFDLAQQVGEPLVGRKWTVWVYPLWSQELAQHTSWFDFDTRLESALIYGTYPEIWLTPGTADKGKNLKELVDAYLYKDILTLDRVKKSKIIRNLLELLAHQIGQEVSLSELGNALDIDKETVSRYLDLLEQAFVIVNIRGFSRNLRKEVSKTSRYYFYDNGIRNALIGSYQPFSQRNDVGALWENWLVMERLKKQQYTGLFANNYFWRTYDQKEIDWIEEREGKLFGYEFSWKEKQIRPATSRLFQNTYSNSELSVIHRGNYRDFVV